MTYLVILRIFQPVIIVVMATAVRNMRIIELTHVTWYCINLFEI
jgi:hypothetical protein